jgi:hypothetical protein
MPNLNRQGCHPFIAQPHVSWAAFQRPRHYRTGGEKCPCLMNLRDVLGVQHAYASCVLFLTSDYTSEPHAALRHVGGFQTMQRHNYVQMPDERHPIGNS